MQRSILGFVILFIGLVLGFVLGRITAPSSATAPDKQASVPVTSNPAHASPGTAFHGMGEMDDTVAPAPAGFTLAQAMALEAGDARDEALERLGMRAGLENPEEARAMLDQITKTQDKEMYLYGLVEGFAPRDPEACLAFLASLPPGMLRETGFEHALELIAEEDPALAATKSSELLQGVSAFNALLSVSDVWAQTDPQAALAWASAQQQNQFRAATVEQIAVSWGENEPEQAIRSLTTAAELTDQEREMALRAVLATWASQSPQQAIGWARANPTPIGSADPMNVALVNWAAEEPSAAAAALMKENNPALVESTAAEIAGVWAAQAPSEAAKWVSSLPSESARTAATLQLVQEWARLDAAGARKWVDALPAGLREAATQRLETPAGMFGQPIPMAEPQIQTIQAVPGSE